MANRTPPEKETLKSKRGKGLAERRGKAADGRRVILYREQRCYTLPGILSPCR